MKIMMMRPDAADSNSWNRQRIRVDRASASLRRALDGLEGAAVVGSTWQVKGWRRRVRRARRALRREERRAAVRHG